MDLDKVLNHGTSASRRNFKQSSSSSIEADILPPSIPKSKKRKEHNGSSHKILKKMDIALEKITKQNPINTSSSSNSSSSSSSSNNISQNRISFIKYMCNKLYTEICNNKGSIDSLIKLLFDASEDVDDDTIWNVSEEDDPIEIIRPKSKMVDFRHARIQPLNWACRKGYLDLLKYLINASPWDDIFTPNLGNDKLFLGAIPFAILSGNKEMVDYLCRELGMDPNRGPTDWEPVLVVFWELNNWDMLLSLIRGGASLYHESTSTASCLRHMYVDGWGWDSETRLDAILTLLFLGVPFYENQEYEWPAYTIDRDYKAFKLTMRDVREVVCWNDNYEYVLNFIPQAREKFQQNVVTKAAQATKAVMSSSNSSSRSTNGRSTNVYHDNNYTSSHNDSINHDVQSLREMTTISSSSSSSSSSVGHISSDKMVVNSINSLITVDNNDNQHVYNDQHEEDHEDDFSTESDDLFDFDERYLIDLKNRWMNSIAILLKRKGISDDMIRLIFKMAIPVLGRT